MIIDEEEEEEIDRSIGCNGCNGGSIDRSGNVVCCDRRMFECLVRKS